MFRLRKRDFERISNIIEKRFPNEISSTFYTKQSSKVRAKGKFYDQYQHIRSTLLSIGLATNRKVKVNRKKRPLPIEDCESDNSEQDEDDKDYAEEQQNRNEEIQIAATLLEAHAGPWEDVIDAWQKTVEIRNVILKDITVHDYICKYPALQSNRGLELVSKAK